MSEYKRVLRLPAWRPVELSALWQRYGRDDLQALYDRRASWVYSGPPFIIAFRYALRRGETKP